MVLAADLFYRVLVIDIEYSVFSNDPIILKHFISHYIAVLEGPHKQYDASQEIRLSMKLVNQKNLRTFGILGIQVLSTSSSRTLMQLLTT